MNVLLTLKVNNFVCTQRSMIIENVLIYPEYEKDKKNLCLMTNYQLEEQQKKNKLQIIDILSIDQSQR